MSETQLLARRIRDLAAKMKIEPTTLSRKLLGSGARLAEIEAGSSMTFTTYARIEAEVAELEKGAAA